jgi:hypothetical protein
MASVLDIGLIQYFDIVFPFLLIALLVYAVLQKTGIIGKSVAVNSVISVCAAVIAILSDAVVQMITFMTPWFVVTFIFFVLLLLVFQIMGAKDGDFELAVKDKAVQWVIIGIGLIIIFAGFATVFGQNFLDMRDDGEVDSETDMIDGGSSDGTSDGSFDSNVTEIFFHPKVLGMIVLFGIAIFAVALLTN